MTWKLIKQKQNTKWDFIYLRHRTQKGIKNYHWNRKKNNKLFVEWVDMHFVPFSVVEHTEFRYLLQNTNYR